MSPPAPTAPTGLVLVLLPLAIGACPSRGGDTGGETHWQRSFLAGCVSDSHCDAPLTCVRNMCTRPCAVDDGCDLEGGELCDGEGRCVVPERQGCTSADPCVARHEGWLCDERPLDDCRASVVVCRDGAWIPGELDTCRGALTETWPATGDAPESIVVKRSETDSPVDILFVVDNSSSMLRAQARISEEVPTFVDRMAMRGIGDFRLAVTTTDAECDPDTLGTASRGRFATRPGDIETFAATTRFDVACREDADCESLCNELACGAEITWQCSRPSADACMRNPNGSQNSRCRPVCESDEGCEALLGGGYTCLEVSGNSGCVQAPAACPDAVPSVLAGSDLALAACLLRTGGSQAPCQKVEQPLEAMRMALDPRGTNPTQHATFVRPHAILAVVVVTDEEDCSLAPDRWLVDADNFRCGVLGSVDEGGPLQTVDHYATFLIGLKAPGRVFFAAIAGDSLAEDVATRDAERAAYVASKSDPRDCHTSTTICTAADLQDSADWGARLFEMAEVLGPDSHVANVCGDDWRAIFVGLGDALAETASRICLPRPPPEGFTIVRDVAGVETPLARRESGSEPGTWRLAAAAPECASGEAVVLADPPEVGERLRFIYPRP